MSQHIFELLEFLEHDLADTYEYLKTRSKIDHLNSTYDYMVEHSRDHAKQVKAMSSGFPSLELDQSAIMIFQKKLKQTLVDYLIDRTDDTAVVAKMTETEKLLGDLYRSISKRFRNIGQAYNGLADTLEKLAGDEDDHQKTVLKELESLKLMRDALGPRKA